MKKSKGIVVIVLVLALMLGLGVYAVNILGATNTKDNHGLILGLDLSGGVSITYKIVNENPSATDIADTIAKMEERAENYRWAKTVLRLRFQVCLMQMLY